MIVFANIPAPFEAAFTVRDRSTTMFMYVKPEELSIEHDGVTVTIPSGVIREFKEMLEASFEIFMSFEEETLMTNTE